MVLLVLLGLFILFLGEAGSELVDFWQCGLMSALDLKGFFPPG